MDRDLIRDMMQSQTAAGAAARERAMVNLEILLLLKEDWQSEEERAGALQEFAQLAARMRALDAPLLN